MAARVVPFERGKPGRGEYLASQPATLPAIGEGAAAHVCGVDVQLTRPRSEPPSSAKPLKSLALPNHRYLLAMSGRHWRRASVEKPDLVSKDRTARAPNLRFLRFSAGRRSAAPANGLPAREVRSLARPAPASLIAIRFRVFQSSSQLRNPGKTYSEGKGRHNKSKFASAERP